MERDWDLIRDVLVRIEQLPPRGYLNSHEIEGVDPDIAGEQMEMLRRAGFLVGTSLTTLSGTRVHATGLEWAGYDLLATIRNDTVWGKIKSAAESKSIELTFDAVKMLAQVVVRQIIGQ